MRTIYVILMALLAGFAVPALMLVPSIYYLLPRTLQNFWFEICYLGLGSILLAFRAGVRSVTWRNWWGVWASRAFGILEAASEWMIRRGFAIVLGLIVAAMFVSWIPHYLTWPWCRDEDTFAVLAQSWDAGVLPYRDIQAYNFPGHIYLHWLLGKTLGWGRTRVFYAFDATLLVGLVVTMTAWSRRRLGSAFPGLAGAYAFLGFYLTIDFEQVAERDWHATLAVGLALMLLEAWPGRRSLWGAAALQAIALTIRPHAILFLPAMICALAERPRAMRAIAEWILAVSLLTVLGFLPLVFSGILDDLLHGLRVASYGGPYSKASPEVALSVLRDELSRPWIYLQLACLVGLIFRGGDLRRPTIVWLLALIAAVFYRTLHPMQHRYLDIPLNLISAITFAIPIAWLSSRNRVPPPSRLLLLILILFEAVPRVPLYCSFRDTAIALPALLSGAELDEPPPGCRLKWFKPDHCPYEWRDYREALGYLRRETQPETEIANVLKQYPFPPFNGPVGRLSPFRTESGICWMWLVDQDLDETYARSLEQTPNSVVVWSEAESLKEPRLKLERLSEVIRRHYRPAARFGTIEIWKRLPRDASNP